MNIVFSMIGMWETVAILAILLVLFGARKVPELARGLGQGIKEFKKATNEVTEDLHRIMEEEEPPPTRPARKLHSSEPKSGEKAEKTVSQSSPTTPES